MACDFLLKVPCQKQQVIRPLRLQHFWTSDRNLVPGHVESLLVLVQIHHVVDHFVAEFCIIEQSTTFCRCTVGRNTRTLTFQSEKEISELRFNLANPLGKPAVIFECVEAGLALVI